MKTFLTGLCILSALLATGDAVNCTVCFAEDADCTSSSKSCDKMSAYKGCQTAVTEVYERENMTSILEKSCILYPLSCNISYSLSTQNFSLRFKSQCCDSENCNTDPVILPPRNTTKNGVICPLCEMVLSEECDSKNQTVECTGEETKCISFSGKIHQTDGRIIQLAYHGCITTEACEAKIKPYPDSQFEKGFTFNCTSGIPTTKLEA